MILSKQVFILFHAYALKNNMWILDQPLSPQLPDLLGSAELAELDPDGSRPLEGMHGLCGRRFDCFDPVCSAAVGVGAETLPSAGIEFLPREDALISQGHPSP